MARRALKAAVVGGGWAGCAAALELGRAGRCVTLFESARTLGGRARGVEINGLRLDNGQHILLGAYRETLRVMRLAEIDPARALLRLPLQMRYPPGSGGMEFIAARLPAPLHVLAALVFARGLARADKLALARFSTTARWMGWRLNTDCSVAELLDRFDQTERLTRLMWRPLCIAALNTAPERASAQVFLNVLRDSLGARRAASDMLIPRVDLGALFPQQAAHAIERAGGAVRCGTAIARIERDGARWRLPPDEEAYDAVIVATPPAAAARLLDGLGAAPLPPFEYEPITTCYLQYAPELRLPQALYALPDDPETGAFGQFVFDRGRLDAGHAGLLAVVVSAASAACALAQDELAKTLAQQLSTVWRRPELAAPRWSKVISEKRATFACTPALCRPANETGIDTLLIAGDYTAGDYPATLEGAVRSGVRAAQLLK